MEEWHRLGGEVPGLEVNWCGGLVWDLAADDLGAFVAERQAQGYDIRLVDGVEAAALEPALANPPELAAHSPAEGAIEPLEATLAVLVDAERRGARLLMGQAVERLVLKGGRVTGVRLADGTELLADRVGLAAGAATPALAARSCQPSITGMRRSITIRWGGAGSRRQTSRASWPSPAGRAARRCSPDSCSSPLSRSAPSTRRCCSATGTW